MTNTRFVIFFVILVVLELAWEFYRERNLYAIIIQGEKRDAIYGPYVGKKRAVKEMEENKFIRAEVEEDAIECSVIRLLPASIWDRKLNKKPKRQSNFWRL